METVTRWYINVYNILFSGQGEPRAPWSDLIANLLQEPNLSKGHHWNNKALAPRDWVHLFLRETPLCYYNFPPVCFTTAKNKCFC